MALSRDALFWSAFVDHAAITVEAAKQLQLMLSEPAKAAALAVVIQELEHRGDAITHDVVSALHQTWITPLDREEIHGLVSRLDDVLDYLHGASDWVALYEITQAEPEAQNLARILVEAAVAIEKSVRALSDMKNAEQILALCKAINRLEHDADAEFRRGIANLLKRGASAVDLMKWRDILGAIEGATDRAEDVANIIEGIVLEHS
jgi:uncharacterized protein